MSSLKPSGLDVRDASEDIGPAEIMWRSAYAAWWEAATSGDWQAEHALRMAQADAWHDLPDQVKAGAWYRWKLSRGEVPEPGTYEPFARECADQNASVVGS